MKIDAGEFEAGSEIAKKYKELAHGLFHNPNGLVEEVAYQAQNLHKLRKAGSRWRSWLEKLLPYTFKFRAENMTDVENVLAALNAKDIMHVKTMIFKAREDFPDVDITMKTGTDWKECRAVFDTVKDAHVAAHSLLPASCYDGKRRYRNEDAVEYVEAIKIQAAVRGMLARKTFDYVLLENNMLPPLKMLDLLSRNKGGFIQDSDAGIEFDGPVGNIVAGVLVGKKDSSIFDPYMPEFYQAIRKHNLLVPNFYEKEHFDEMADWTDSKFQRFKDYVVKAVCFEDFVRTGVEECLDGFIMDDSDSDDGNWDARDNATTKIQATVRGFLTRRHLEHQVSAANLIQTAVRNRKLKRILNTYKKICSLTTSQLQELDARTGLPLVQLRGMSMLQGIYEMSIVKKVAVMHKVKYGPVHAADDKDSDSDDDGFLTAAESEGSDIE